MSASGAYKGTLSPRSSHATEPVHERNDILLCGPGLTDGRATVQSASAADLELSHCRWIRGSGLVEWRQGQSKRHVGSLLYEATSAASSSEALASRRMTETPKDDGMVATVAVINHQPKWAPGVAYPVLLATHDHSSQAPSRRTVYRSEDGLG